MLLLGRFRIWSACGWVSEPTEISSSDQRRTRWAQSPGMPRVLGMFRTIRTTTRFLSEWTEVQLALKFCWQGHRFETVHPCTTMGCCTHSDSSDCRTPSASGFRPVPTRRHCPSNAFHDCSCPDRLSFLCSGHRKRTHSSALSSCSLSQGFSCPWHDCPFTLDPAR